MVLHSDRVGAAGKSVALGLEHHGWQGAAEMDCRHGHCEEHRSSGKEDTSGGEVPLDTVYSAEG